MTVGTRTIVIAASERETTHLPDDVEVVITGRGKVDAAVTTAKLLSDIPADERAGVQVVNLGSCGALRDGLAGVYEPRAVINHDISADAIRALGHDVVDEYSLDGADDIVLATGDLFVADAAVRDQLAERASLVDMEGFAVVAACQEFGVPVRVVKHVSDAADEQALEWTTLVARSAEELGDWFAEHIHN